MVATNNFPKNENLIASGKTYNNL